MIWNSKRGKPGLAQVAGKSPTPEPCRRDGRPQLRALRLDLTILIVEPEQYLRDLLEASLTPVFRQVHTAESATDANRFVRRWKMDLVISNIGLLDESAWLMVSKWHIGRAPRHIWLYGPNQSVLDAHWAEFTHVEELIYFGEDWRQLPALLIERVRQRAPRSILLQCN